MITVYGIETASPLLFFPPKYCRNVMITVYGIETDYYQSLSASAVL